MKCNSVLKINNLSKRFGVTRALKNISLNFCESEIIGLIGENGSGKSTLASILAGIYSIDEGTIEFFGKEYRPNNPLEAQEQGISMITQELGTIATLSVASNIFLGKEDLFTRGGLVNEKRMFTEARDLLSVVGADHIKPHIITSDYSFEDRKIIEIARALYCDPKVIIIDETTTALSHDGRQIIYSLIRKAKKQNKIVVFISHDIEELMDVCTKVIVLRDGDYIAELDKEEFNSNLIKELMVGRELTDSYYREDYGSDTNDNVVLFVENIFSENQLSDISFDLHKGEILGIGGLTDSGMHELGKILFGAIKPLVGEVRLNSGKIIQNTKNAVENKIGYVSKNRDEESLILDASIKDNSVLATLRKNQKFSIVQSRFETNFVNKQMDALNIKAKDINQNVSELSGGNKQKVAFSKWLGSDSNILILDCPTRGIDVGVKAFMYQLMYELKKEGKSIIMISEELPELIGMSDRILIMKNGKIANTFHRSPCLNESDLIKEMI